MLNRKCLILLLIFCLVLVPEFSVTTASDTGSVTLNVVDYGAQPNAVTDQTVFLMRAINSARYGDTVYIPDGTYPITTLSVPDGVTLKGQSRERTILSMTVENSYGFYFEDQIDVRLESFTIQGNDIAKHGVLANRCDNLVIHDIGILHIASNGEGICFRDDVNHSEISNCFIQDMGVCHEIPEVPEGEDPLEKIWGAGIRIAGNCSNIDVLNNRIDRTGRGGVLVLGTRDLHVIGNTITNSGYTVGQGLGVEIWGTVGQSDENLRTIVQDNYIDHWYSGGGTNHAVRGNIIGDGNNDEMIKGFGLENWHVDSIICDNQENAGHGYGISDLGGQRMLYARNTIQNNIQWGIQIMKPNPDTNNSQKYFYKTDFLNNIKGHPAAIYPGADGIGVRVHSGAWYYTFEQCNVSGNGSTGFELGSTYYNDSDYLSIENCTVNNNAGDAFTYGGYDHIEITGTTASGNRTNTIPTSNSFGNQKPTASMQFPNTVVAGQPVTFTSTSSDADGTIADVLWDFGDGIPSTESTATYVYEEPGVYPVTLTVWDNGKRGAVCEGQITVTPSAQQQAGITTDGLKHRLSVAETMLANAVAGSETGQYPQEAIDRLRAAYNAASGYVGALDQGLVDSAAQAMQSNLALFSNSRIRMRQSAFEVPRDQIAVCSGLAAKVNDGMSNTEWEQAVGSSVVLFLKNPTDVSGIIYYSNQSNGCKTGDYEIAVSNDGVNFTTVKSGQFPLRSVDQVEKYDVRFDAPAVRYLKFTAKTAMYGSTCGASEIIVLGDIQSEDFDMDFVCRDNFVYEDGTLLRNAATSPASGFSGGWVADLNGTPLGENFTVSEMAANVVTEFYPESGYAQPVMYRRLAQPVDFDKNDVYYLIFKMCHRDNYGGFSSYLSIGEQLSVGLAVGETGTSIGGQITFSALLGAQKWNDGAQMNLSFGTFYPIVAKIVTRANGADALYVRLFRTTDELEFPDTDWQQVLETELSGTVDYLKYQTTLIQPGFSSGIDDISLHRVRCLVQDAGSAAMQEGVGSIYRLQSGKVTLHKTLESYHLNGETAQVITVLYHQNGKSTLDVSSHTFNDAFSQTVTSSQMDVSADDGADDQMKLLIWDQSAPLQPLCKPVVLDRTGVY